MRKEISIALPDEPFKNTTDNGKTFTCIYDGPKYFAVAVAVDTGVVQYVARTGDTVAELDLQKLTYGGTIPVQFVVLDVSENILQALILQPSFAVFDKPDNFEEVLPDGQIYVYEYESLTNIYDQYSIKFENGAWSDPLFVKPAETRQSYLEGIAGWMAQINKTVNNYADEYTESDLVHLNQLAAWANSFETAYADIDHWKIKLPEVHVPLK